MPGHAVAGTAGSGRLDRRPRPGHRTAAACAVARGDAGGQRFSEHSRCSSAPFVAFDHSGSAPPATGSRMRESAVLTRVQNDRVAVYANVAVHADVEIKLVLHGDHLDGAAILFGPDGPDLRIDFADVDGLERLAVAAADGVRRLRGLTAAPGRDSAPSGC